MIATAKLHFERKRAPKAQAKNIFTIKQYKYPRCQFDLVFALKLKLTLSLLNINLKHLLTHLPVLNLNSTATSATIV